jgi:hypothetical protein
VSGATSITVRVPMAIRKRGGRKVIVSPDGSVLPGAARQETTAADPALLKALGRAFRWKRMLEDGRYASVSEIARAEKLDRTYVGDMLRLTLLAPDIVEAIVDAQQPAEMTLPGLIKGLPVEWAWQQTLLRSKKLSVHAPRSPLRPESHESVTSNIPKGVGDPGR